jgi:hypothetical protein
MSWESKNAAYQQIAEEMLGASRFGDEPVLIVADTADAELVYGRGADMNSISPSRDPIESLNYTLSVLDDPYPVVTK